MLHNHAGFEQILARRTALGSHPDPTERISDGALATLGACVGGAVIILPIALISCLAIICGRFIRL